MLTPTTITRSHSPFPLVSVKWVMLEDLCVSYFTAPLLPLGEVPVQPSPLRVCPSTALMCSAASWRISLVTVVTADNAPSSPAPCCPSWWTTRWMLGSNVWLSSLGKSEGGGEGDIDNRRGRSDDYEPFPLRQLPFGSGVMNTHTAGTHPGRVRSA